MARLHLISGGRDDLRLGRLRLTVVPPPGPAEAVAAIVVEEDTWQVLSAVPEVVTPDEHSVRLLTELLGAEPLPPGSLLIREEVPLRLLAVVYDVGVEPVCRPDWVADALREVFRIARQRDLLSIAMPLLGVRHGRLPIDSFIALLAGALRQRATDRLKRLWLLTPEEADGEVRRYLSKHVAASE